MALRKTFSRELIRGLLSRLVFQVCVMLSPESDFVHFEHVRMLQCVCQAVWAPFKAAALKQK